MLKPVKTNASFKKARIGEFAPHAHKFIRFIWQDIVDRDLQVKSVADAAGVDASTLHKWRRSIKGPFLFQLEEVLEVLGYELKIVRKEDK